jgi:hypothetical protein
MFLLRCRISASSHRKPLHLGAAIVYPPSSPAHAVHARAWYQAASDRDGDGILAMEFIDRLPEIQAPMQILHHNVTTVNLKLDGDIASRSPTGRICTSLRS